MSRTLKVVVYGVVAAMQLAVALFLLDHLPVGHARPAPLPAPGRSSLLERGHVLPAGPAPGRLRI